jgi:hypothetical protein
MSNEQAAPQAAGGPAASERCVCHELKQHFEKFFEISPDVRQHLANSRMEFLKAIRAVIDQRIEHLAQAQQRGSRIAVE